MIDTIIFDLDGTLLNTLEDLTFSVNHALLHCNFPPRTLEEVKDRVGNGVSKLIERCIPDGKDNPLFEETFNIFKEHYEVHCKDMTKPYDGILPLLDELCVKGYKLGIVSNKFDKAVKELNTLYFGDRILSAVGESDKIRKKPAPDTAYQVLEELSSSKDRSIYVGDSGVDVATAANVPMRCISVTWGFRTKEQLLEAGADPALMITSPQELLPLIQSLSQEE
ncbi:MAG: HAD hydrolase-like protein [Lachnospiraceae bacterium]|nr:HAD hydrolase-like protein [Lachnospiraceae bacterium]